MTGILAKAPKRGTEYEKAKFVYQYLIENTEYVLDADNNQNICSVFLNGCSVCQGYAKGAQYLLHELGVNAALVTGTADFGEEHAWNIVEIDGKYYHMDVTWGDASYTLQGQETSLKQTTPEINYEYLCIPDSQLFLTHKPDTELQLPVCDSLDANYYVMEGAYFTRADLGQTEALFQKAKTKEKFFVSFKCADAGVYAEMEEVLIGEQRVFAFLPIGAQTIAFSKNEEQLILSFWLQD